MGEKQTIGVIDIGSNSVRLVVYDRLSRVPHPIVNEKVLCGLARQLDRTGVLYPLGKQRALQALARFTTLARAMKLQEVTALATSAVRDAHDGPAFVKELDSTLGLKVDVLSGAEEARFAGYGILAAMPQAEGLVADLGGGSLELVPIEGGELKSGVSLPIGPLRFSNGHDIDTIKKLISNTCEHSQIVKAVEGKVLYALGGGFRTLAKLHMEKTKYPLRLVHEYRVNPAEFKSFCESITDMNKSQREKIESMTDRKVDVLALTAQILRQLIVNGKPKYLVFSVYGIREGYLYRTMPAHIRSQDPLFAACMDLLTIEGERARGEHLRLAKELLNWIKPLFPDDTKEDERLRLAATILLKLAILEHVNFRGETAFRMLLHAPLTALSHPARVFLALSVFHRYCSECEDNVDKLARKFISRKAMQQARLTGVALRLAYVLYAGAPGILEAARLKKTNKHLILELLPVGHGLVGEAVEKRLSKLADLMQLEPAIKYVNA